MKNTMTDKLGDKLDADDKSSCLDSVNKGLEWLETHSDSATAEDFEEKRKDVADICDPIVAKVYQESDMGSEDTHDEL
jgi:hypothetical protein